jgi:hypothetical protein
MADSLETLFKNLGPNTAAMWAGEREALNNYASEASTAHQQQQIQDLLQKHAQNELMNPLEVQNKQLTNRGLEAGLPGTIADSRRKGMEADTYDATQASSIAKTNSTNEYEVLNNKIKQTDTLVDMLGKGSKALENQLPAVRHAYLYDQIEKIAGPQARKDWEQNLQRINPNDLPAFLNNMSQHQAMSSTGMRQELEKLRIQGEKQKDVARIGADATKYAADQRLAASSAHKKGLADIQTAIQSGKMNYEQAATAFRGAAAFEPDEEKAKFYLKLADEYAQKKAETPKVGTPDIAATTQNAVPTNKVTPFSNTTPMGKPLPPGFKRIN